MLTLMCSLLPQALFTPGIPQGNRAIEYRLAGFCGQFLITEEITLTLELVWQVSKRRCQTLLYPCTLQHHKRLRVNVIQEVTFLVAVRRFVVEQSVVKI